MKNEIKEAAVVTKDTVNAENAVAKFEVGKKYRQAHSNEEYAYTITVEKRTRNYLTVTVENNYGITVKESRRLRIFEGSTMEIVEYNGRQRLHLVFHSLDVVKESNTPIMEIAQDDAAEIFSAAEEVKGTAVVTKDTVSAENAVAKNEEKIFTLVTGIDRANSGAYQVYNREFKSKEAAFKYFLKKTYRGTTEFYVYIFEGVPFASDSKELFGYSSLGSAGMVSEDPTIARLIKEYDEKRAIETAIAECQEFVRFVKEHPEYIEVVKKHREDAAIAKARYLINNVREQLAEAAIKSIKDIESEMDSAVEDEALATVGEVWDYEEIGTPEMTLEEKERIVKIAEEVMQETAEERKAKDKAALLAEIEKIKGMDAEIFNVAEEVPFEIGRFGEVDEIAEKFNAAVVDSLIEEFSAKVKGIIAAVNKEFKFDAQRFNDEETATPAVEEAPVVDEEKALIEECGALEKKIEEMEEKLSALEKARFNVVCKLQAIYNKRYGIARKNVQKIVRKAGAKGAMIEIHAQDNEYYWFADSRYWNAIYCSIDHHGRLEINFEDREIASYSDIETFKAAVREFAAAIERGDEVYTFPADGAKKAQKK